jgi:hypothetical protein
MVRGPRWCALKMSSFVPGRFAFVAAMVGLTLAACAPRLDRVRYASDQAHCPQVQPPRGEDASKLPTDTIRLRAQTAEVERQTFLMSGGQTCLGNGAYVDAWSGLLRERTTSSR